MRAPSSQIRIGCDVVEIKRLGKALLRGGDAFREELFSHNERAEAADNTQELSRLFAIKEAAIKAIGTGLSEGVTLRQFEVQKLKHGWHRVNFNSTTELLAYSELRLNYAYARAWLVNAEEPS